MQVVISRRATEQLEELYTLSEQTWGTQVAESYLDAIDAALDMLSKHPGLLRKREGVESIGTYTVRKHLLICTILEDIIYVLMVKYGGMDMETMLEELEPALMQEAQIMHTKLKKAHKKS